MWTDGRKCPRHQGGPSTRSGAQHVHDGAGLWIEKGRSTPAHTLCTVRPQVINWLCTGGGMPRIEGVLQICCGAGRDGGVWVEILDSQGKCFVLGQPGEHVDIVVVKNVRRAVCPTCEGERIIYATRMCSLIPTSIDFCSRCKGRGFIPVTELTRDEVPIAVVDGVVKRS